jgi:thermitase
MHIRRRRLPASLLAGLLAVALVAPTGLSASAQGSDTGVRTAAKKQSRLQQPAFDATAGNDLVVVYRPGQGAGARRSAKASGARVRSEAPRSRALVVEAPEGSVANAARWLERQPDVEYVEPLVNYELLLEPNDSMWSVQWGMKRIGAPSAWDVTTGSPSVKIAIIDTGVDAAHPDLRDTGGVSRVDVANGRNFENSSSNTHDSDGHGTAVAGVAAAAINNGLGVAGVAGACQILPLKVFSAEGNARSDHVAEAIRYAADQKAVVINLSLGGPDPSQIVRDACDYARAKGSVVIAAAGNFNTYPPLYPAAFPGVVAVGSTSDKDTRSNFSQYGPQIDVVAPGEGIHSTAPGASYAVKSGTSFSAPHVAGTAALLASKNTTWTAEQVKAALSASARDLGAAGYDEFYGFGLLQADKALRLVNPPAAPARGDANIPGVPLPVSPVAGRLDEALGDLNDVYAIKLDRGDTLSLSLTATKDAASTVVPDFDLYLYGPSAQDVDLDTPLAGSEKTSYPEQVTYKATRTATYYVTVFSASGSGAYALTWKRTPAEPYQISISAPSTVSWGGSATVSATYKEKGFGAANKAVSLQSRVGTGSWTTIATKTTNTQGIASFAVKPTRKTSYRARIEYLGSAKFSTSSTITPKPYLTISAPTDVSRSKEFAVSGYLKPKHAKGAKDVVIKCYLNGTLKKSVSAVNANYTNSSGATYTKYSAKVSLPTKGKWTLKAYIAGDEVHTSFTTKGKSVYVNRPKLSLSASRTTVEYSKPATLTGYLKTRSGKALAGRKVRLQKSTDSGSTWTTSKTLTSSSTGKVTASVKPERKTSYRFRFSGDTTFAAVNSSSKTITPRKYTGGGYFTERTATSEPHRVSKGRHRVRVTADRGLSGLKAFNYAYTWERDIGRGTTFSPGVRTTVYVDIPSTENHGLVFFNTAAGRAYGNTVSYEIW